MPRELIDSMVCLGCGYSLRGLPNTVCPECGRAYDPLDDSTFRVLPRPAFLYWRRFAAPPSTWELLAFSGIGLLALEGYSRPMGLTVVVYIIFVLACFCPFVFCAVTILYGVRMFAVVYDRKRSERDQRHGKRRRGWRWVLPALSIFVATSPVIVNWPLIIRFHLSRADFQQAAEEALSGENRNTAPQWIGLYRVTDVHSQAGAVYFQTGHDEFYSGPTVGFGFCVGRDDSNYAPRIIRYIPRTEQKWFTWSAW